MDKQLDAKKEIGTVITCPHCEHGHELEVKHDPFNIGGHEFYRLVDGEAKNLKTEGVYTCNKCRRSFMFRFHTVIVCATAPYPFENM